MKEENIHRALGLNAPSWDKCSDIPEQYRREQPNKLLFTTGYRGFGGCRRVINSSHVSPRLSCDLVILRLQLLGLLRPRWETRAERLQASSVRQLEVSEGLAHNDLGRTAAQHFIAGPGVF